ncbi:hypothetical protein ABW19_dt0202280 [Dactylella cylindrospora]|nr:hypothetical protein ABW19_dt0202280 [Dactylella cylindrospora]
MSSSHRRLNLSGPAEPTECTNTYIPAPEWEQVPFDSSYSQWVTNGSGGFGPADEGDDDDDDDDIEDDDDVYGDDDEEEIEDDD